MAVMLRLKLAILLCGMVLSGVVHGQATVYFDSLENRDNTFYYEGRPYTGVVYGIDKDEDDDIQSPWVGYFFDGKANGPWRGYYDAQMTKIRWECEQRNGLNEGLYIYYFEDGSVALTLPYHKERTHGKQYCYNEEGALWHIHSHRNDRKNGPMLVYYTDSGNLRSKKRYQNNRITGRYRSYHNNGALETSGRYLNGKRVGVWRKYDADGRLELRVRPGERW